MSIFLVFVKIIPSIISTIFKHYLYGPPQPSWNLKIHLNVKIVQSFFSFIPILRIEDAQRRIFQDPKIPSDMKANKITIPHRYRVNAQAYIEKLIKPYAIVIDPIWKTPNNNGINGEIIMDKNWNGENDWSKEKIVICLHGGAYLAGSTAMLREIVCKLSKISGARFLSISYRLAPQQPFPAALCDALATYLFLTNPPDDSGLKPYKPEQIVIGGESAGGGLSISLGLAIRDSGLPLPAGIFGWSPWSDLTHSMPSFFDPIMDKTDYLPAIPGLPIPSNPNSIAYNDYRTRTGNIIQNIRRHPEIKIIGDDSLKRIGDQSICGYIVNEGLGIPYVSPMLAESLGGLPPMLIVAGNVERLRDESIYLSYRAANPEKYRLPKYEVDFDKSRFKSPTKITFELFEEMSHIFQYIDSKPSRISIQRTGEFISNIIKEATLNNSSSHKFDAFKISYQGEVQDLDESSIENVLNWDKAGVFPI